MKKIMLYIKIIVSSTFLLFFCFQDGICQDRVANLDTLLESMHRREQFNGNVLVAEKGKVLFQKSFGFANFTTKKRLNKNTAFQIASASKTFTAVSIMILKERGKLKYEDKIVRYLPSFPYKHITIKQLLNHTSGMYPYNPLFKKYWSDKTKIATNKDVLAMYVEHKPETFFEPGTEFSYANMGYVILAEIVEAISKQRFENFLKTNIFRPLKMNRTQIYTKLCKKRVGNVAREHVYSLESNKYVFPETLSGNEEVVYLHGKTGDDKVISTTDDMLKWDRALYTEKLVSRATLKEAFTSTTKNLDPLKIHGSFDYGMGFQLKQHKKYGKIVYHNGGEPGLKARFIRYVDHDRTIIIFSNARIRYVQALKDAIAKILYGLPFEIPKRSVAEQLQSVILQNDTASVKKNFIKMKLSSASYYLSERELNKVAGDLWALKEYKKGLVVLKLNVESFPNSTNARYTLAEGFMESGNTPEAIKHFEITLRMAQKKPKQNARYILHVKKLIRNLKDKKLKSLK